MNVKRPDVLISCDVEADGPIPGPYSLSSVGLYVIGAWDGSTLTRTDPDNPDNHFYRELKPISDQFVPEAAAVAGLDRDDLITNGTRPVDAMTDLNTFARNAAAQFSGQPVFVAFPLGYDWLWVYWYLMRFTGRSVFSHGMHADIRTLYARAAHVPFSATQKRRMNRDLFPTGRKHTHNALDDAIEQGLLAANILEWSPTPDPSTGGTP